MMVYTAYQGIRQIQRYQAISKLEHIDKKTVGWQALLSFALPAMIAVGLEPIAELIDTAFLGQFKSEWVAAVAATNAFLASFAWIFNFLSYSVTSQIGQSLGRGDSKQLGHLIKTTIAIAIGLGLSVVAILYFGQDFFLRKLLDVNQTLYPHAVAYWQLRVLGFPFTLISLALIGVLRGFGEIRKTIYVVAFVTFVNASGTYISLYCFNWGISGAAAATSISFICGDALGLFWICKNRYQISWGWFDAISLRDLTSFGRDSLNLFGRSASLNIAFFSLTAAASHLGTQTLAAHQITLQLWLLASYLTDGLAVTATSLGAKLIGAGEVKLQRVMSLRLLGLSLLSGTFLASTYWIFKTEIISIFTRTQSISQELSTVWFILAGMQIINGPLYVLDGIFFGRREFVFLRRRVFEGLTMFFLPALAWGFWIDESLQGLWSAMAVFSSYRMISAAYGLRSKFEAYKQDASNNKI